ncbi:MAG: SH3 domain-containing protein [Anaerolineae bacterium]|jgi:uncharacterized protein YraI|nr:SH3 domain-containing protein [Anaerolineae bacterium]
MRKLTIVGLVTVMILVLTLGAGLPVKRVEANPGTKWNAKYYSNKDLSGQPAVERVDDQIDFNWADGSPDAAIPADNFSARWVKTVNFDTAGVWTFKAGADDGVRMWVDDSLVIDEWHDATSGFTSYEITLTELTAGKHRLKVEYYEATGLAGVQVQWWQGGGENDQDGDVTPPVGGEADWNASYYRNHGLADEPVLTRVDKKIDFNWGKKSPDDVIPVDYFSARWTATVYFSVPGHWIFEIGVDDGVRMWIDDTQIIDEWHATQEGYNEYKTDLWELTAGTHNLKVEYFEATNNAEIHVSWRWEPLPDEEGGIDGGGGSTVKPAPPPVKPIWAAVTGDNVNVRTGPGRGNPVIVQVFYPENYLVLGAVPDMTWILISLGDGREGWVSNEWVWLFSEDKEKNQDKDEDTYQDFVPLIPRIDIEITPGQYTPVEPNPTVTVLGLTLAPLRMRDGASLQAKQIGTIPDGVGVVVEARNGNGAWYLVLYEGIRGWVNAPYVQLTEGRVSDLVVSTEVVPVPPTGTLFVPETETGQPAVTVRGRALDNLRLRDAASLRGNEIGKVPLNSEFVIMGRNTNGAWYHITFGDMVGWVNAAYVTLIEGRVYDLPIH